MLEKSFEKCVCLRGRRKSLEVKTEAKVVKPVTFYDNHSVQINWLTEKYPI